MSLKNTIFSILFLLLVPQTQAIAANWQLNQIDEHVTLLNWGKPAGGLVNLSLMVADKLRVAYPLSAVSSVKDNPFVNFVSSKPECISLSDVLHSAKPLTQLCIVELENGSWSAELADGQIESVLGLGQEHDYSNNADGDWLERSRENSGNELVYQNNGAVGNTQIPVLYLLGKGGENIGLFFDHPLPMSFYFDQQPYEIEGHGNSVNVFVISGKDLPEIRSRYMALTGRAPVPPKAMFGLWLSEYGFDDWQEMDEKLQPIQQRRMPISGVVLDLQWFGGISSGSKNTKMGSLTWDQTHFANHQSKIAELKQQGVGVMLIEEPNVGGNLPEHSQLEKHNALVLSSDSASAPLELSNNPWWGIGGMIDYSNEQGAAFWHDYRREALIDDGIIAHWTDLGEPEAYSGKAWYAGVTIDGELRHDHKSVNNLYNLLWSKSIYDGYTRNKRTQRPFIMSRSGTAGSQRYGVAMWSGDIGSSLDNLRGQFNVQSQMSLSGIDYFGSDIGGFHGNSDDERYTQWLAASLFTDVPVRPHTQNLCNCKETSPEKSGHFQSNFYNLKQRYSFEPYYYTAAHLAWRDGLAVVAPLVYRYQQDKQARLSGRMKLIGSDILVALEADDGAKSTQVYLPKGQWFDYRLATMRSGNGLWSEEPLYLRGLYRLPIFIRAGAIIPRQGEQNVLDLLVVLDENGAATGRLIDDDGKSIAYQSGEFSETQFEAQPTAQSLSFIIYPTQGHYKGAPKLRDYRLEIVNVSSSVSEVFLGEQKLEAWQQKKSKLVITLNELAVDTKQKLNIKFKIDGNTDE